jgi:integrase
MGTMDHAWCHLMLHSGLRVGEVRRLRAPDLDLERRSVRIEQSKGLKDRTVPLSPANVAALQAYLPLRGPAEGDHVFTYRHLPLSQSYCYERLQTYGERCGVRATPHQLRHSCATLLLNAGAPILTVQAVLGHQQIDTTLEYARLYDGTVAADYYRAMAQVERDLQLDDLPVPVTLGSGQMVALLDSLVSGTLNEGQRATVGTLRAAILALSEHERPPETSAMPPATVPQAV